GLLINHIYAILPSRQRQRSCCLSAFVGLLSGKREFSFFVTVPANHGQKRSAAAALCDAPIAGERYAQPFPVRSDGRSVRRDNCSVWLQQRQIVVGGPIGRRRERRCSCDDRRCGGDEWFVVRGRS